MAIQGGCPHEETMKLKTVEIEGKTYAVLDQGMPVYVHDDGKEATFDAVATVSHLTPPCWSA
jgi:hypothetical protein